MNKQKLMVFILLTFFASGCTSLKPTSSGFLGDYSKLEPVENHKKRLVAENPKKDLGEYTKFLIDPVVVQLQSGSKAEKVGQEKLDKLAQELYDAIVMELGAKYEIVEQSGPDTLRIRAAITDVVPTNVLLNLHISSAILLGPGVGGAVIEAEFVDSLSGERVMAVVEAKKGKSYKYYKGFSKLGHTEDVLRQWAKWLVETINSHHGLGGEDNG